MGLVVHNAPLCALPVPPHEPIETRHQPRRRNAMMTARPKRPRLQAPTPMRPSGLHVRPGNRPYDASAAATLSALPSPKPASLLHSPLRPLSPIQASSLHLA